MSSPRTDVAKAILEHTASCWEKGAAGQFKTEIQALRTRTDRWSGAIVLALALIGVALYFHPLVIRGIVREEIQKAMIGAPAVVPGPAHAAAP